MTTLAIVSGCLLVAVWVGYPLCMRLLASLTRSAPLPAPATWPRVSVIIASRDPAEQLKARIADVLSADYPADRLQVVAALDAESPVEPDALATGDGRVRVVRAGPPPGKASALNAGAAAAEGELLIFTDTHQRFAPDAISQLVTVLAAGTFGITSGQLELPEAGRASLVERYWRMERRLRRDEARVHSAVGVSGSIYGMRRELWRPLPAGLILDDLYIPMRLVLAGERVGFTESARAFDVRRTAPAEEYQRKVRTLTGNFQLCAWLPGVLVPVRNPVWIQFVFHKLLRLLTPYLLLGLVVGIAGSMVQALGWSVLLIAALAAAGLVALAAAAGRWRTVRGLAAWGISMQSAILTATFNGLLGRWDVWRRTR